jgi:hypothetical protein
MDQYAEDRKNLFFDIHDPDELSLAESSFTGSGTAGANDSATTNDDGNINESGESKALTDFLSAKV